MRSYPTRKNRQRPTKWNDRRPLVTLTRGQRTCLESAAPFRAFVGGIGSGKSFLGSYDIIRRARDQRMYLAAGPTYPVLRDATMRSFLALARKLGVLVKSRMGGEPSAVIRTRDNGLATIIFRTTKDPELLRGPNLSGVWLDEASLMRPGVYDVVIGRLREAGQQGFLLATYTPKGRGAWVARTFESGAPDTACFRAKTRDNPFLPRGFEERLRRKYSRRYAEQELEGVTLDDGGSAVPLDDWLACEADDCLWPVRNEATGATFPPPADVRIGDLFGGIDVGRSRHRFVFWTWERVSGGLLVAREILVLHDTPYATQEAEVRRRLRCGRYAKVKIDKGLMGGPLAEGLERDWPGVVEGEQMSSPYQGKLAEQMSVAFERRNVRVPEGDDDTRDDFQQVDKATLNKEGRTVVKTSETELGHGDRFWAAALGMDAAMYAETSVVARPRGSVAGTAAPNVYNGGNGRPAVPAARIPGRPRGGF